jgi:hypothetical protein
MVEVVNSDPAGGGVTPGPPGDVVVEVAAGYVLLLELPKWLKVGKWYLEESVLEAESLAVAVTEELSVVDRVGCDNVGWGRVPLPLACEVLEDDSEAELDVAEPDGEDEEVAEVELEVTDRVDEVELDVTDRVDEVELEVLDVEDEVELAVLDVEDEVVCAISSSANW